MPHAAISCSSQDVLCLSDRTVFQDVVAVWRELYGQDQPPIILVGHSMGGAVAVRSAATEVNSAFIVC